MLQFLNPLQRQLFSFSSWLQISNVSMQSLFVAPFYRRTHLQRPRFPEQPLLIDMIFMYHLLQSLVFSLGMLRLGERRLVLSNINELNEMISSANRDTTPLQNKVKYPASTSIGAIHLWRPHEGGRGQAQVDGGGGQAPCGRPHKKLKLESTDVILSSSHAKKLAYFFTRISSLDGIKSGNFSRYKLVI